MFLDGGIMEWMFLDGEIMEYGECVWKVKLNCKRIWKGIFTEYNKH